MYIVPLNGPDVRFLGGSAASRNARVARRVGATICALRDLPRDRSATAVVVPAHVALMASLFDDPAFLTAAAAGLPLWLDSGPGASVLVGPAAKVGADLPSLAAFPRQMVSPGLILNVSTPADRREATRMALRATQKVTDGWVSRTLNRPVSRACSRVALSVGMTASTASFITLLIGLGCAWIAAQPGYVPLVLTGILFQLASILDGVDGEIARATLTESDNGARVDTIVDQVTYVACFAGATIGWVREGSGTVALASTLFIGFALVLTLLRGGRFVSQHADNASFVFIDRAVRRAALDTGRLPLRLAAAAFTLLRRDLFAIIFLVVSLTGVRAMIPALIVVGILIANLTFTFYGSELADAARAERAPAPAFGASVAPGV
jgi:CDP-L-myo-inositol myo-inositolphosphotransferase